MLQHAVDLCFDPPWRAGRVVKFQLARRRRRHALFIETPHDASHRQAIVGDPREYLPHDGRLRLVEHPHAALFVASVAVQLAAVAVNLAHKHALILAAQAALPDLLALFLAAVALHVANQRRLVGIVEGLGHEVQRHAGALALFRQDGQVDRVTREAIGGVADEGGEVPGLEVRAVLTELGPVP